MVSKSRGRLGVQFGHHAVLDDEGRLGVVRSPERNEPQGGVLAGKAVEVHRLLVHEPDAADHAAHGRSSLGFREMPAGRT